MKRILVFIPVLLLLLVLSCSKENNSTPANNTVSFAAVLNGSNETPPNASAATGTASGSYNKTTKILTLTISYTGLTVVAAHIHKGDMGVSGGVEFPITVTASPVMFTSPALTTSEEEDLLENKYYVNLHSAAYVDGEIRGQLIKQ